MAYHGEELDGTELVDKTASLEGGYVELVGLSLAEKNAESDKELHGDSDADKKKANGDEPDAESGAEKTSQEIPPSPPPADKKGADLIGNAKGIK